MLYYHNIWLSYGTWTETTPRFVTCKFDACVISSKNCVPAQKHWLHSDVNLADELVNKQIVILLIFVNNEHFVNAVTMWKVSHVDKMRMQTMREQGFKAKAIIRVYPHKQWKLSSVQPICLSVDATGSAVERQAGADSEWQRVTTNLRVNSSNNKEWSQNARRHAYRPMVNTLNT